MSSNSGPETKTMSTAGDAMIEVGENAAVSTEVDQSRFNSVARTCVRVAFAKHIALYNMLSDPEAFLKIED